ncbi:MAG: hypothetical protein Q7J79_06970, partial [Gemmatimonadales bacterium]|nr:hypothetical protein [Gemmatimonadales bacterium]
MGRAVILARGLGTSMRRADPAATLDQEQRSAADAGMKGMIRIGRPFLDYLLSALANAGIRDVCLVVGPEHDAVRGRYEGRVPFDVLCEATDPHLVQIEMNLFWIVHGGGDPL